MGNGAVASVRIEEGPWDIFKIMKKEFLQVSYYLNLQPLEKMVDIFSLFLASEGLGGFAPIGLPRLHMSQSDQELYRGYLNSVLDPEKKERCHEPSLLLLRAVKTVVEEKKELIVKQIAIECVRLMPCMCKTRPQIVNIVEHWIQTFGDLPVCDEMDWITRYHLLMKRLPEVSEFRSYMQEEISIHHDPVAHYQRTRHATPTPNLLQLKEQTRKKETKRDDWGCSLCKEEVETFYFQLPCGHVFHSKPSDCLGDRTIMYWLQSHRTCPNCKQEVKIQDCAPKEPEVSPTEPHATTQSSENQPSLSGPLPHQVTTPRLGQ